MQIQTRSTHVPMSAWPLGCAGAIGLLLPMLQQVLDYVGYFTTSKLCPHTEGRGRGSLSCYDLRGSICLLPPVIS